MSPPTRAAALQPCTNSLLHEFYIASSTLLEQMCLRDANHIRLRGGHHLALIKDLVKSLDDSHGSSAEYQAVIRELWSLDHALLEVEVLFRSCGQNIQLNALSVTAHECAEQCRKCIMKFHEQVKRFGKGLRSGGSGSFIKDTALKIRWQVSEKEDLAKFRAEINAHCLSINMLLTTTGVFVSTSYELVALC